MANNYKHTKTVTNNMKVRSLVNIDNNGTFITSGYWESIGYDTYCCSKCGVRYTKPIFQIMKRSDDDPDFPNYCPVCGDCKVSFIN